VERLIIHLKRLADCAQERGANRSRSPDRQRAALDKAVTWCIERYFEGQA
jgi:hypothetical protein